MKVKISVLVLLCSCALVLSGCVVRTYPVTKERVDQELNVGNRGYLKGEVLYGETKDRKTTRTTQVVEIELHSPIKFEKAPKVLSGKTKAIEKREDSEALGNRGYLFQSETPKILETEPAVTGISFEKYTVRKGDTLQKIAQKFYGTSKKWSKIYAANKDILRGPDKIYPGQVINVPLEQLKETKENLK